jgi:hypothetical protein
MPVADEGPAVSRRTRLLVHLFLVVFAVCGVAHLELFPFSGFRRFSELRPAERQSWQLRAVDAAGEEIPIRIGDLPIGYRNTSAQLRHFEDRSQAEQDAMCDAWAEPLRASGTEVTSVRIYSVVQGVRPNSPAPVRELAFECGGSG